MAPALNTLQERRRARSAGDFLRRHRLLLWLCAPFYRVAGAVRNTAAARDRSHRMNASLKLLQSVLPTSVGLRVKISSAHPSAQILGTDRMGSGTLIDPSGIILTVNYVALGADNIEVTLLDETRLEGHVIAQDFFTGLAAIKIPGEGYPAARWAGANELRTGQEVFIVASAGGSQRRVNSGGISSLDQFDAFWEFHLERGIL